MIEQIIIAICGLTSVFLSQDKRPNWQRWACIFGLVAQPFWMYVTWKAQQWGIFGLSFVYAAGWIRGVYNFWYLPWKRSQITEATKLMFRDMSMFGIGAINLDGYTHVPAKDLFNQFPRVDHDTYKAEQERKNREATVLIDVISRSQAKLDSMPVPDFNVKVPRFYPSTTRPKRQKVRKS